MPTLSDIYISNRRALLTHLPPGQAAPILARLAEMDRILDDQKPPT